MKKKVMMIVSAILLIGMLAACSPFNATPRTLAVSGDGKVYLVPDLAYINIGVETQAASVSEALTDNTTKAQAVASALTNQGIDPKDIQTSNFNVSPQQSYDANGKSTGTTYIVDNTVYVTVRDLTKLGAILDAVTSSGANNINSISFDSTKTDTATVDARKAAIADARQQAQTMADAAGVTLDAVQTISVNATSPVTLFDVKSASAANLGGGSSSIPVSAGQILIEATANLTYTIK